MAGIDTLNQYSKLLGWANNRDRDRGESKGILAGKEYRRENNKTRGSPGIPSRPPSASRQQPVYPLAACKLRGDRRKRRHEDIPYHLRKEVRNPITGELVEEKEPAVAAQIDITGKL
jgi:hypothetical protein